MRHAEASRPDWAIGPRLHRSRSLPTGAPETAGALGNMLNGWLAGSAIAAATDAPRFPAEAPPPVNDRHRFISGFDQQQRLVKGSLKVEYPLCLSSLKERATALRWGRLLTKGGCRWATVMGVRCLLDCGRRASPK